MRARLVLAFSVVLSRAAVAQSDSPLDIFAMRQQLVRHEWPALQAALTARRAESAADDARETRYVYAYDAFVSGDSALQRHFDAWVAAQPSSSIPRAARGTYFVRMGVAASEVRDEAGHRVPSADAAGRRWAALAREDARAAARLDSTEPMAPLILLSTVKIERDSAAMREALDSALALRATTLEARMRYMELLLPEMGGSMTQMARFAASAQRYAAANPRLRTLVAMRDFDEGMRAAADGRHDEAIAACTRAIATHDYWRFRYMRGMEYFRTQALTLALIDLNRAVAERPGYAPALAGRAWVLAHLSNAEPKETRPGARERAETARQLAITLDRTDEDVLASQGEDRGSGVPVPPRAVLSEMPLPSAFDRPADLLALRALLVAHQFASLDSSLVERDADARLHPARELRLAAAMDVFATSDTSLKAPLDAWVARSKAPALALAARSMYFASQGWNARGRDFASKVGGDHWARMEALLKLAYADGARSATLDRSSVAAHFAMIDVAQLSGREDMSRAVLADAVTRQPLWVTVRARYMSLLRPRWGGSDSALQDFAARAQADSARNPHLAFLLGMADYDAAESLRENDEFSAAVTRYDRALSHGDYWRYRVGRAQAYRDLEMLPRALADLEIAVAERPAHADLLAWRAVVLAQLAENADAAVADRLLRRGRADFVMARTLDAGDAIVRWAPKYSPQLVEKPAKP